jgi:hypothetical protein
MINTPNMTASELLEACDGVDTVVIPPTKYSSHPRTKFFKTGDIVVPDDIHIEITNTPTAGTIGRLVDIDYGDYLHKDNQIGEYGITYIIQIEGRKATNRIHRAYAKILQNFTGPTVYKRNITKKGPKEDIPEHVNKYNQAIFMGDWIAGLGPGKVLYFGQVTRWSKTSVWVNPTPSVKGSKSNCISHPRQSMRLQGDTVDNEQMVTMMILSGWTV